MEDYGSPANRIFTLLSMFQGECPFERLKGMKGEFIDMPTTIVKPLIIDHVKWLLKTYEPDLNILSVSVYEDNEVEGIAFGNLKIVVEYEE